MRDYVGTTIRIPSPFPPKHQGVEAEMACSLRMMSEGYIYKERRGAARKSRF